MSRRSLFAEKVCSVVRVQTPDPEFVSDADIQIHRVVGSDRIDQIAADFYGNPRWWRVIAEFNDIADPLQLRPGQILRIPRRAILEHHA